MRNYAADDFDVIHKEVRRNRVIEMGIGAGLMPSQEIPVEIFLSAGFTHEEIGGLGSARRWPILEYELR